MQRSATVPPRSAGGPFGEVGGEEDLEELGDAVGGDVGRDRLLAPVRRLAVPAVDRRLLGHPPPPEGGEVRADGPVPDRGVGLGGLQHAGERLGALLEPADKLWARRQGDVGGRMALGFEVADSPGHGAVDAAGVLHQIGDGPGGARWHAGVKAQPGGLGEGGAVGEQRGDAAILLHAGEYGRRGSWGQAGRGFQAAVGRARDAAGRADYTLTRGADRYEGRFGGVRAWVVGGVMRQIFGRMHWRIAIPYTLLIGALPVRAERLPGGVPEPGPGRVAADAPDGRGPAGRRGGPADAGRGRRGGAERGAGDPASGAGAAPLQSDGCPHHDRGPAGRGAGRLGGRPCPDGEPRQRARRSRRRWPAAARRAA